MALNGSINIALYFFIINKRNNREFHFNLRLSLSKGGIRQLHKSDKSFKNSNGKGEEKSEAQTHLSTSISPSDAFVLMCDKYYPKVYTF